MTRSEDTTSTRTLPLELKLDRPGTLSPPGPIGRLVRLGWGGFLGLAAYSTWTGRAGLVGWTVPVQPFWWLGNAVLLAVFPYVVNIGYGVAWGAWPRRVAATAFLAGVSVNLLATGAPWSPTLAWAVIAWQLYVMAHLGGSFVLAAIIGTPGCEMRAIPHLWTLVTGRPTEEHYCPGHIDAVDRWEAARGVER